jgi:hypothetical protein
MRKLLMLSMVGMLALFTPAFAASNANRIVTAIDESAKTFSCHAKAGEPSWTYKTTEKTVYRIAGKRVRLSYIWNKGRFSGIKIGEIVSVTYHLDGHDRIAERVAIYPRH